MLHHTSASSPPTAPQQTAFAALLAELCPQDGYHATAIPNFYLIRASSTATPRNTLQKAVLCVVAQGSKSILMNGTRHRYDPSHFLLVSLDMPLVGQVEEASPSKPFLACSLMLDFDEITALLLDAKQKLRTGEPLRPGLAIGRLDGPLTNAFMRLAELTRHPEQVDVLAPLICREIYYRLLLSGYSGLLQRLVHENGKASRIAAGLAWLRQNATRPVRMEELARELHMSPSTMHAWFRAVTAMSPLQFQKQLRLQEARRLMLAESLDAATAARRVGYESPSQFSREYGRLFGAPPVRDVERLRAEAIRQHDQVPLTVPTPGLLRRLDLEMLG